ncbi:hypothetical protein BDM02DRAFT_3121011 [Thelephora ganbajun]|uniref:Uncharacterized protein n=2 Tax=Thelephora ganbajun TaxID=370292 RepID=A0ACB6Z5P9_THEGA|nr:hypothetical protein BDM02DRAFT_3121822 [Thelephora ganbajun]KAF9644992.1 hypothetical protein BDM02DRAFT_3121011 [Thelephora ganbajun]
MDELHTVAEDRVSSRTPEIVPATAGASADSTFHVHQLPSSNEDGFPPLMVRIEALDASTTARRYVQLYPTIRGKIAVLDLASDECRAGG